MVWEPRDVNEAEQKRIEERASADAREMTKRIWRDGMPGNGSLEPIAVHATHDYIAALRQESGAIPRWAWVSQEAMQQYIQQQGDRYYYAFLDVLARTIANFVINFRAVPRVFTTVAAEEEPSEDAPHNPPARRTRKRS